MAGDRRAGRERGKSDPIDAVAVARAALREPDLPVAQLDGESRQLRLLVDHREYLVRERTRIRCRLRWHLHELFPGFVIAPKALRRLCVLDVLERRLAGVGGTVAAIAAELVASTRELTVRANEIEAEIREIVRRLAPALLALSGCGVLSAAKIVGEFRSVERDGAHPGVVGQSRPPAAQPYVERRMAAGDSKTEALRMLRRRLSDEVFRRLLVDEVFFASAADSAKRAA